MFRAMISLIFRSTRLCVTACGILHPRCCRPVLFKATGRTTSWVPVEYLGGFWGVQTNPPTSQHSEVLTKSNRITNWAENVYCSYSNIVISLKIAEFRTPTPQDVRKESSKILKLPRFVIILHLQLQINWLSSYRVIHKSLRDFRTRLRNNQDRHGRKENINR